MNLLPLEARRRLHMAQTASWLSGQSHFADNRSLPTRAHNESRKNIKIQKIKKTIYQNSFIYKAAKIWNSLSTQIHCIEDTEKLKVKLRENIKNLTYL